MQAIYSIGLLRKEKRKVDKKEKGIGIVADVLLNLFQVQHRGSAPRLYPRRPLDLIAESITQKLIEVKKKKKRGPVHLEQYWAVLTQFSLILILIANTIFL
ncbi:hypothetical protein EDC96DRAFT_549766 [Choanephora cucurbitarum]|nr:hypothetical protein EDC96DRAFT_549766 [Choanephora cucurbitarum]